MAIDQTICIILSAVLGIVLWLLNLIVIKRM